MTLPLPLQTFWEDQTAVIDSLYARGEVSLAQSAQNIFAKSLIMIAASYFETAIRDAVVQAIEKRSKNDACVISFCQRKGIERQFHTWFDWKQNNTNLFFSLFGDEIKRSSAQAMKDNNRFDKAAKAYMFVGRTRNELVHNNLLTFPLNETAEQAREKIEEAAVFIELVETMLIP